MGKSPAGQADKPIVFTDHARDRMAERGRHPDEWPIVNGHAEPITEEAVLEAIATGRQFSRDGRTYHVKGPITAVVIETADVRKVLTVLDTI